MSNDNITVSSLPDWIDDKDRPTCTDCQKKFTQIRRRHHCRVCGDVFCGDCCFTKLAIPELGYVGKTRVCEGCRQVYQTGGGVSELALRRPKSISTSASLLPGVSSLGLSAPPGLSASGPASQPPPVAALPPPPPLPKSLPPAAPPPNVIHLIEEGAIQHLTTPTSPPVLSPRAAPPASSSGGAPSSSAAPPEKSPEEMLKQRQFVVREFVDTEESYVKSLTFIVQKFLNPIRRDRVLPLLELGEIFSNVEILEMANQELCSDLKQAFSLAQPGAGGILDYCIGDTFLKHVKNLIPIYTPYCLNQTRSVSTLERCSNPKKFPAFAKLCNEVLQDPGCDNPNIMSWLIKPVQRLCKYPLLLRELIKCTPSTHPDYEPITDAMKLTQSLVDEVNSSKREAENLRNMLSVTSQLSGADNLRLMMPGRRFLMEASLVKISVHNKHQTRQFFLFNDLLIYAAKAAIGKKYSFKGFYYMNQIELVDVPDSDSLKNAFCIIRQDSIKKKHVIYSDSPKEKADWLQALSQCIAEARPSASSSHLELPRADSSSPASSSGGVAFKVVSSSTIDAQQQLQMVDVENRVEGWTNDQPKHRYLITEVGPYECQYVGMTSDTKRWVFVFNDSILFTSKQSDKEYGFKHFALGKRLKFRVTGLGSLYFPEGRDIESPFTLFFSSLKERDEFRDLLLKIRAMDEGAGWAPSEVIITGGGAKVIRVTMKNPALKAFGMEDTFKTLSMLEDTTVAALEEQMMQKLTARIDAANRQVVIDACQDYHLFEGETQLAPDELPYSRTVSQLVFRRR